MKMKKIIKFLILPMVLILGLVGCSKEESKEPSTNNLNPTVTTDEGLKIINDNKDNQDFVLLDVRTKSEYDELYIAGSINKPLMDYDLFIEAISDISKDKRILIYCRTDNRSKQAYDYMQQAGYEKCQYMLGGITKCPSGTTMSPRAAQRTRFRPRSSSQTSPTSAGTGSETRIRKNLISTTG